MIKAYKDLLSRWPTGVAILTLVSQNGPCGMTIGSFVGVSLKPAIISVCINRQSYMCSLLKISKKFVVNILHSSQKNEAIVFSDPKTNMKERFSSQRFYAINSDSIVLADCLGWLDCNIHKTYNAGDHLIFISKVKKIKLVNNKKSPLIFCCRGWVNKI